MSDNRYQELVFGINQYKWNKTDEEARELMWKDITKFLEMLTKNEYIAVVYDDDTDIIVVQFEHNERTDAWGAANPVWITEEEYSRIELGEEIEE